jgi:hypothetical protein
MFGKNKNQIKNNCVSKNKIANAKIFADRSEHLFDLR